MATVTITVTGGTNPSVSPDPADVNKGDTVIFSGASGTLTYGASLFVQSSPQDVPTSASGLQIKSNSTNGNHTYSIKLSVVGQGDIPGTIKVG